MMEFVTIGAWPSSEPKDYRSDLEKGNVLYFRATPFRLPEEDQQFLRSLNFSGGAVHKNIAYRPLSDRVTGVEASDGQRDRLLETMRSYSQAVVKFTSELLPEYAAAWKLDYASFCTPMHSRRDRPMAV
jgi:3-deoxy-D-manno-oct-2-ulosonic acid (Kdo) hydroxylase